MATDLERLTVQVDATLVKFDRALARMEGRSAASAKKVEKTFAAMQGRLNTSFGAVLGGARGALGIAGVGLGASQVIQYADSWTRATNALKVAGISGLELTSTLDALYAAAQRQGAPLEALTVLYGRAAQFQKELGANSRQLIQFSEDVATALRVAGTSPQDATGALLQLSQALGSARVQAEEFNSINEGARPILQAVANGIEEAGGSVSKLRVLVTDGQISNVAFFKGFQAGIQTIRDQAAEAEPTISQAFTRVQNAIIRLVGEINNSAGFSAQFVDGLSSIADGMKDLVHPIKEVIGWLEQLGTWYNSILTMSRQFGLAVGNVLGTTAIGEAVNPAIDAFLGPQGGNVGPSVRNTARSQTPPPISVKDYPVIGGKEKKEKLDDYARETAQIRERTAALQLEAQTVGMSTFEAEKAKAAFDLLNAAKAAGKTITADLTAQIDAEAEAHARAVVELEKAREAQQRAEEQQRAFGAAFSGTLSAIAKGEDAIDALTASLERLADQLIDMISDQLFKQLMGGIPGLNFSGGTVGNTTGASFGMVGAASGGAIRGPGTGTSDSILARLSNGEFVVRAAMAKRYGPLLEAINAGRWQLPAFATGGGVGGPVPRASAPAAPQNQIVFHGAPNGTRVEEGDDGAGGRRVDVFFDEQVANSLSRPGSRAQRAVRGVGGVTRR